MSAGLTPHQRQALTWIARYIAANGHGPSLGEIGTALGVRHSSARVMVARLAERGAIAITKGRWRSIRLLGGPAVLPPDLKARLDAYCAVAGLDADAVVARAVSDHLQAAHIRQVCATAGITAEVTQ